MPRALRLAPQVSAVDGQDLTSRRQQIFDLIENCSNSVNIYTGAVYKKALDAA